MPSPLSAAAPPHVAVVVLNYNGLDDTVACLRSLTRIAYQPLSIILVDNGSNVDPGEAALAACPGLDVIRTGENLGYAGGNNRGIQAALARGAEFVLVLNNDTIVDPFIVESLSAAFGTDEKLGIVGPVINFMDEPETVMTDGARFNPGPGTEFFRRVVVPLTASPVPVDVDIVNGCCMMIRASLLRDVGTFDEDFFIIHEESDLCLRALRAGYRCAVLGRTLVWHKGSSSFDRSGRQVQRYFDTRNLFYLLRRHTGHVGASRPFSTSLWHYFRYVSYRFETEVEAGKAPAARAVAEGLRAALAGTVGPDQGRKTIGAAGVEFGLRWAWHLSQLKRRLTA